jgi:hypothetical protein
MPVNTLKRNNTGEKISSDRKPENKRGYHTEPGLALGVTPRIIRLLPAVSSVYAAF